MNDEPTNDYPDWGLLGAWVAVVESESVSHAARRLGLSQAAVSMRVKMLEGKLGPDLLDRGTPPATVTPPRPRARAGRAHPRLPSPPPNQVPSPPGGPTRGRKPSAHPARRGGPSCA